MNLLKEEIDHFGEQVERAIRLSGEEIDARIDKVGQSIETGIERIADELTKQRNLTRSDAEYLIRYASEQVGQALDVRIEKLRAETSDLITTKLTEAKLQLQNAADNHKRMAIRNATVAVGASIVVGVISLIYRKFWDGDIFLIDIFRPGQPCWRSQAATVPGSSSSLAFATFPAIRSRKTRSLLASGNWRYFGRETSGATYWCCFWFCCFGRC